jgi:hypothetical protein
MRDLTVRVPVETVAELAEAVGVLEHYTGVVCQALETLRRAATEAWHQVEVPPSLNPAELPETTDDEWFAAEQTLGIARGMDLALLIDQANPQSC